MSELQSAVVLVLDAKSRIICVDNLAHGGVGMPGGKVEPDGALTKLKAMDLIEKVRNGFRASNDLMGGA